MRILIAAALLLAACSGKEEEGNATPPAPQPTGPAPRTPTTNVSPLPGGEPGWLEAQSNAGDPAEAPYDEAAADEPLVNARGR